MTNERETTERRFVEVKLDGWALDASLLFDFDEPANLPFVVYPTEEACREATGDMGGFAQPVPVRVVCTLPSI